jgi:hypothetical protein
MMMNNSQDSELILAVSKFKLPLLVNARKVITQ